ncbi:amino acid ABC transporter permease [Caballeronia sp. LjRoot29]|uniref:amino acid ABC transporter permease n=1 Tax=Caballeronia sp. LjRoot29 TaxID=3342315 RepID=UPI003ECC35D3
MLFNLTPEQFFYIFRGAGWTIVLSMLGVAGGVLLGIPIALARVSRHTWLKRASGLYVQINQAIPLPVTMFVVYFGISIGGYTVPVLVAAALALTVNAAAYLGEIWRGSIESVPSTQWEASESLALSYVQRMQYVILPQALRISIPPTVGFVVALVKNTSYAVVIGMSELTYSSRVVNNTTFQPFVIFTIAAGLYFMMCYPLSVLSLRLERIVRQA